MKRRGECLDMEKIIPKTIHYCWFGGGQLPELARNCIESWRKFCPDYKIVEWNESNFDLNVCKYVQEAYDEKKWAFVSDYARFWILYNYGGVYVDTDVEFIRSIDDIVSQGAFMGCEPALQGMNNKDSINKLKFFVNPGLGIAAPAHHFFIKEVLNSYESRSFYKESGELNLVTIVETTTVILKNYGYKDSNSIQKIADFTIYPVDYFCPRNYITGELNLTDNTYSIHHYTASWQNNKAKRQFEVLQRLNSKFNDKVAYRIWRFYTLPFRVENKIRVLGLKETMKFVLRKMGK